jgi:hypothetical protein
MSRLRAKLTEKTDPIRLEKNIIGNLLQLSIDFKNLARDIKKGGNPQEFRHEIEDLIRVANDTGDDIGELFAISGYYPD